MKGVEGGTKWNLSKASVASGRTSRKHFAWFWCFKALELLRDRRKRRNGALMSHFWGQHLEKDHREPRHFPDLDSTART